MKILIMAGGGGTRLWPLSTRKQPKQFQELLKEKSLFQLAVSLLRPDFDFKDIFVATNLSYKELVRKQVPEISKENIILEPVKRDTAPCIALTSAKIFKREPEATLAVLTSDHLIQKEDSLKKVLRNIEDFLKENPKFLVTLGVKPTFPATCYGYIKISTPKYQKEDFKIYGVENFKEKPCIEVAKKYIASKEYFWNSGMFVWKAKTILGEFKEHAPDIYQRLVKIQRSLETKYEEKIIKEEYPKMNKISIDFAVMEKSKNVVCLPVELGWSDIGSWASFKDVFSQKEENLVRAEHMGIDTKGCLIFGPKDKLITTIGLRDFVIIATEKAFLVCPKKRAQDVKKIVKELEAGKKEQYL